MHRCDARSWGGRTTRSDGQSPGPDDQGWKDTVFLNKGEKVQLAIQFSTYTGRYVFHWFRWRTG